MMRPHVSMFLLALLPACTGQTGTPPADCDTARAQFDTCVDRHLTAGGDREFEAMWYACIPHSEPRIIKGAWATDFEWNALFKGRVPSPEEAFSCHHTPTGLSFKSGIEAPAVSHNNARLWELEFVGREETCRIDPDLAPTIFVEEIRSSRLVWEGPGFASGQPVLPKP